MAKPAKTAKKQQTAAEFVASASKDSRKRNGNRPNFAWKKGHP